MSLSETAKAQAAEKARLEHLDSLIKGSNNPQDKNYVADDAEWESMVYHAEESLAAKLGAYPDADTARRLEPESWAMRNFAHAYPAQIKRRRVLQHEVDGHEVATIRRSNGEGFHHYVVRRPNNPMEEVAMLEFDDLPSFGDAIS